MSHLAVAGIVAPIIFAVLVVAQGLLQPDYSHIAMPISALATWPAGWIQTLNFYVFGVLMTAYAAGLHFGIRPGGAGFPMKMVCAASIRASESSTGLREGMCRRVPAAEEDETPSRSS